MDHDKTTSFDLRSVLGEEPTRKGSDRQACLIVITGAEPGRVYWLEGGEIIIGRDANATVCLKDDGISRQHAVLRQREDRKYILEDLGSSNGTFCNNQPVTSQPLRDGDRLHLGMSTVVKFGYRDELEQDFLAQQYEAATRDVLTGCFNKRYFLEQLNIEHSFAERHSRYFALALLDVDYFKQVNDTFGHHAGDEILQGTAETIRSELRAEDVLARYGGEEFALLLRDTNADAAAAVLERIRRAVASAMWRSQGQTISVTISGGFVIFGPESEASPDELLVAADEALYRAKRAGRNRTVRAA